MLAMDVWCFSKSTIRVDLEKHQTRLHYWGNSLCNFEEAPLQFWVFLLCTKQPYDYFEYLLTEIPKHMEDKDLRFCEDLLPWSPALPERCRKHIGNSQPS